MKDLFLFIADISGYTAFMVQSEKEKNHGALAINELMKSLVKEVALPLEISKLEGDALFLYLLRDELLDEDRTRFTGQILRFFTLFRKKVTELYHSTACNCGACQGIEHLKLKIVAHYGKAEIEEIGRFQELSGIDVILAHRLLKNAVEGDCYLLMTDPIREFLLLPESGRRVESMERDKDLGEIHVTAYYPPGAGIIEPKPPLTPLEKAKSHFEIGIRAGLLKKRSYLHFPPEKR